MLLDITITEFNIESVEKAYRQIKTTALFDSMLGVVTAVCIGIVASKMLKIYREATPKSGGKVDMKGVMQLIWQYIWIIAVLAILPFAISGIEWILGDMQSSIIKAIGGEKTSVKDFLITQMDKLQAAYPDGISIFESLGAIFKYCAVMFLTPILAYAIKYMYALFLAGRYFYLLLLELVAPIAIVCSIDEKREKHFETWLKHMLVCYLMIPAFLLANAMGDIMNIAFFGESAGVMTLLAGFVMKLSLFGAAKRYVTQLL